MDNGKQDWVGGMLTVYDKTTVGRHLQIAHFKRMSCRGNQAHSIPVVMDYHFFPGKKERMNKRAPSAFCNVMPSFSTIQLAVKTVLCGAPVA